jgi:hypothetical protein
MFSTDNINHNILENLTQNSATSKYVTLRWNITVFKDVLSYISVDTRIYQRLRNPLPEYSHSLVLTFLDCLIGLIFFNSERFMLSNGLEKWS